MWLSWLVIAPQSERSQVGFPVKAQAWVAGAVPSWDVYERQPIHVSHSERKEKKVVCGSEHTLQDSDFQNVGPLGLLNRSVWG